MALIFAMVMLLVLSLIGLAAVITSSTDALIAGNQRVAGQTFYCADAGLDRAVADHLYELTALSSDWSNTTLATPTGDVLFSTTGAPLGATIFTRPTESMWLVSNDIVRYADGDASGWVTLGACKYRVRLLRVSGQTKEVYIRSRGEQTVGGITVARVNVIHMKVEDASPWSSAVFGGSGASGEITGNVAVHGSVHLLADGASSSTVVWNMSGSSGIYNNYRDGIAGGIPTTMKNRIPAKTTLDAKFRVKRGKAQISNASAEIGQTSTCTTGKCAMDGVFLGTGNAMDCGSNCGNIRSDNGYTNGYDLGNKLKMPKLKNSAQSGGNDPTTASGLSSTSVERDFNFGGFSGAAANILPSSLTSVCTINDSAGSFRSVIGSDLISWDKPGKKLVITGKISLESVSCTGNLITIGYSSPARTITYQGRGTIFGGTDENHSGAYPRFLIQGGLVTLDSSTSTYRNDFPQDHALGIITGYRIELTDPDSGADNTIMGAFYAEQYFKITKALNLAGSVLTSTVEITQVPSFFQVPALSDYVPPGMPKGPPLWIFSIREWWEVSNPQL